MIKHHLNDELLMAYSAGTLPEAFNIVVATHISMCDECRARLEALDAVGGALVETGDAVDVAGDCYDRVLAMIGGGAPEQQEPVTSAFPSPLASYLPERESDIAWRAAGMGVRQSILKTSKAASVRLLHIPAGAAMPDHGHHGTELTLVLRGAFRDETDRFGPGDIEIADEDLHHTPVAEPNEDCICLAATNAPLKFTGWLPRLAQPFLRI